MQKSQRLASKIRRQNRLKIICAALATAAPFTAAAQGGASIESALGLIGVIILFLVVIAAFFKILAYDAAKTKPTSQIDHRTAAGRHQKKAQQKKYRPKHS